MKNLSLLSLLFTLISCMPSVGPTPADPKENENVDIPALGVKVKVAYVHLKSVNLNEAYNPNFQVQMMNLWLSYDAVYMYIEPGVGLRSWDFGSVKLMYSMPVKLWSHEDANRTTQWHYHESQTSKLEDNNVLDYSWYKKYGFEGEFTRPPFGMHYRMPQNRDVKFNIIGAHVDASKSTQETDSLTRLMDGVEEVSWGTKRTVMFGNITQDCQNEMDGLIILKDNGECYNQSVVMNPAAKSVSTISVILPEDNNNYRMLTDFPIIEVELSL